MLDKKNNLRCFAHLKGFTLVELMVAMALSLMVVAVAMVALSGSGQGLKTTDSTAQLNDAAMLVSSVMQRSAVQAGYQPSSSTTLTREAYFSNFAQRPYPDVYGRNATQMSTTKASVQASNVKDFYTGGGSGGLVTTANPNGNDLLAIRFQAVPEGDETQNGLTAMADLCTGELLKTNPHSVYSAADQSEVHKPIYTFFVVGDVLYCKGWASATGSDDAIAAPIVDGVVAFKVLYGIHGGGALPAPNQWKPASSMAATDWFRVKRIRIGLLLRSKPNTGPIHSASASFYPLGKEFFSSTNAGTKIDVNYADGRVYHAINFTVGVNNLLTPRNE